MGKCCLLLGLLAFGADVASAARRPPPVLGPSSSTDLAGHIEVLDEGSLRRTPLAVAASDSWGPPAVALDRSSSSVWWVRFTMVAPAGAGPTWLILPDPRWRRVELWTGSLSGAPRAVSGLDLAASRRSLPRGDLALPLVVPAGTQSEVLLRLEADFRDYAPPRTVLREVRSAPFDRAQRERGRALHGAYGGLVLALVLYNLFLGLALRDRTYLLYVAFAANFGLIWLAREGLAFELLWPSLPAFDRTATFVFIGAALAFGNLFAIAFLELQRTAPALARLLEIATVALGLVGIAALGSWWIVAETSLALLALVSALVYPLAGVVAWRRGVAPARTFTLASLTLVAGVVAYILAYLGALPVHPLTTHAAQIGSAVQMLLLAFALAERIRELRDQRDAAQALVREGLEHEVASRTSELEAQRQRVDGIRIEVEEANRRLVEANRRLEEASLRDQLTGLANRRRFDRALAAEWAIARSEDRWLALVLLDVDYFKAFNDRFGHQAGDRCLQRLARLLATAVRPQQDLVARWGGEELALLLPGVTPAVARATTEHIRTLVEGVDFSPDGSDVVRITVSAGLATARPRHDEGSTETLLRAADDALYQAKREGRNRVVSA